MLEAIDLDSVRSHGYCFQVELTQRALLRGFIVREVPIIFHDRLHGHSKMSPWIALEAFVVLPQLRSPRQLAAEAAVAAARHPAAGARDASMADA